jgi:Zn-dependent membrane protease YugP
MFNPHTMTSAEIEQSGHEYGAELAAALVLASRRVGGDLQMKRQMAQIVLREVGSAVQNLRRTSAPLLLVAAYEQACRAGVREELERSLAGDAAHRTARQAA